MWSGAGPLGSGRSGLRAGEPNPASGRARPGERARCQGEPAATTTFSPARPVARIRPVADRRQTAAGHRPDQTAIGRTALLLTTPPPSGWKADWIRPARPRFRPLAYSGLSCTSGRPQDASTLEARPAPDVLVRFQHGRHVSEDPASTGPAPDAVPCATRAPHGCAARPTRRPRPPPAFPRHPMRDPAPDAGRTRPGTRSEAARRSGLQPHHGRDAARCPAASSPRAGPTPPCDDDRDGPGAQGPRVDRPPCTRRIRPRRPQPGCAVDTSCRHLHGASLVAVAGRTHRRRRRPRGMARMGDAT